jgi:hypothetical protein
MKEFLTLDKDYCFVNLHCIISYYYIILGYIMWRYTTLYCFIITIIYTINLYILSLCHIRLNYMLYFSKIIFLYYIVLYYIIDLLKCK